MGHLGRPLDLVPGRRGAAIEEVVPDTLVEHGGRCRWRRAGCPGSGRGYPARRSGCARR
jgi:hypothetical protein